MRPIVLKGHERALNYVTYNREGDLLFSCSKAHNICAWYTDNGERLGTYDGHAGTVWYIDVDTDSKRLLSASADMTVKLWDVETGKQLMNFDHPAPVRCVNFSHGDQFFVTAADAKMGQVPTIRLYGLGDGSLDSIDSDPLQIIVAEHPINKVYWGPTNRHLLTCHENGLINVWDIETKTIIAKNHDHSASVKQLSFDAEYFTCLSASSDTTAKLFDLKSMQCMKTYKTNRPINASTLSPIVDHVIVGGGQEAKDVTTTSMRAGKFDAVFFNKLHEEELGSVKGHFGPIHTLQFSPNGKQYTSGSEDGYIRIHNFDDSYFSQAAKYQ